MSAENIGVIATVVATLIALVASVIILARHFVRLENKIDRTREGLESKIDRTREGLESRIDRTREELENRIDEIRDGINQTIRQSNGMLGLFGTLIGLLSEQGIIEKKNFGPILKDFAQIGRIGEIHPNPLSLEEVTRLNGYIRRAQQGGLFTREEVEEYNSLVRKLEQEKPNNPDVWPLLALAALLSGLYLVNKK
ncbi:MAG: hypothetical protein HY670_08645 [Chloroflexi bacterium]|nr:hypothetical protein [Chloroflexota bacterium]